MCWLMSHQRIIFINERHSFLRFADSARVEREKKEPSKSPKGTKQSSRYCNYFSFINCCAAVAASIKVSRLKCNLDFFARRNGSGVCWALVGVVYVWYVYVAADADKPRNLSTWTNLSIPLWQSKWHLSSDLSWLRSIKIMLQWRFGAQISPVDFIHCAKITNYWNYRAPPAAIAIKYHFLLTIFVSLRIRLQQT